MLPLRQNLTDIYSIAKTNSIQDIISLKREVGSTVFSCLPISLLPKATHARLHARLHARVRPQPHFPYKCGSLSLYPLLYLLLGPD